MIGEGPHRSDSTSSQSRPADQMTAHDSKETSDADSGIVLDGPVCPVCPLKEQSSRGLQVRRQSLEQRLEHCLLELRNICLREAELTGTLPSDFPLTPDEKPPRVRQRIGASFKLDGGLVQRGPQDSEVLVLERDLAVQQQIFRASHRLCQEEKLCRSQRRSRLQQLMRDEKKVQELQQVLMQHHRRGTSRDLHTSDSDSSLSDVVALDEDVDSDASPSDGVQRSGGEDPPLQNSPWKESCLDTPGPQGRAGGCSRTEDTCVWSGPGVSTRASGRFPLSQFIRNAALRQSHSLSSPSTPELLVRRHHSLRLHKSDSGRTPAAQLCSSPPRSSPGLGSSSLSSSGDLDVRDRPTETPKLRPPPYGLHLSSSPRVTCQQRRLKLPPPYTRLVRTPSLNQSPGHQVQLRPRDVVLQELKSWHQRNRLHRPGPGPEASGSQVKQVWGAVVLQRSEDGTPVQWFVEDEGELISQV